LIRLERVSVERALAWIDAATGCLDTEETAFETPANRILAEDVRAQNPIPPADCAAIDGYAVCAEDSLGAGAYNPLAVAAGTVEAGQALPVGMDAIVPFDQAEPNEAGGVVLVEPVAAGASIDRQGAVASADALLIAAGTRLTARHIGMIAIAGVARVPVIRRPRVRLVVARYARSGEPFDGNGPMLRALVDRDGGIVTDAPLADAFAPGADLVLVAGGTGRSHEDRSVAALSACGKLDLHGVALAPGETAGFGRLAGGTPALLLPGAPAACLWNYELFAGRAIRRLGGRDPALPYPSRPVVTVRKIVSAIGMTEVCPIRCLADGHIAPVASFAEAGLMAAIQGDGFVVVPEASEGYPAGAQITAYFYDERQIRAEPMS
jgi:molybdopterin molybdotransferase